MVIWYALRDNMDASDMMDVLGLIPTFINDANHLPAWKQLDNNYSHGGGWQPFKGFEIVDKDKMTIKYPGDPIYEPYARAQLRDETIYVYPYSWILILQKDGSFEISRMD